ncbi:hypothetical protein [Streptomyces goshikiensis]
MRRRTSAPERPTLGRVRRGSAFRHLDASLTSRAARTTARCADA